jgi:hypothetical protein
MTGVWTGGHLSTVNGSDGFHGVWGCSHTVSISSQTGGQFSGGTRIQGNGAGSDSYCTDDLDVAGEVTADGKVTDLHFTRTSRSGTSEPCPHLSSATFTGTLSSDGRRLTAEVREQMTCRIPAPVIRDVSGERVFTLTFDKVSNGS